jgi:hypothetical protein
MEPDADTQGFDPRADYVEHFWLGILGPSTTLLCRYIAREFDRSPAGFELDLYECAQALGLGGRGGKHSPFMRALRRLQQFGLARDIGNDTLEVRVHVPPLNHHQLNRLSPRLQALHHQRLQHPSHPRNTS